jgi:hypothetical protein
MPVKIKAVSKKLISMICVLNAAEKFIFMPIGWKIM